MHLQVECRTKDTDEPWKIAQLFTMEEFKKMEEEKTHDFTLLASVVASTWQEDGSLDLTLKTRRVPYERVKEDQEIKELDHD